MKLNLNRIERNLVMPKIERKIGVVGAEVEETDYKVKTEGNIMDLKEESSEDGEQGEVREELTKTKQEIKNKAKKENKVEEGEEDKAEVGVDNQDQESIEKGLMRINLFMLVYIF